MARPDSVSQLQFLLVHFLSIYYVFPNFSIVFQQVAFRLYASVLSILIDN